MGEGKCGLPILFILNSNNFTQSSRRIELIIFFNMTIIYLEYISFELPARIYEDESAVIEISAILRLDMKLFYI